MKPVATRKPLSRDDAWKQLASAVPKQFLRGVDTLYAIPLNLLKAIQAHAKGFLSPDDVGLETQLTSITRGGFFQRQRFRYPEYLLGEDFTGLEDEFETAAAQDLQSLEDLSPEVKEARQHSRDFVAQWATAFVGWLVTNREFRKAVAEFRENWKARVRKDGFPPGPRKHLAWISGDGGKKVKISDEDKRFAWDIQRLRDAWCVKSMLTWDLPLPFEADFDSPFMYDPFEVSRAGILILLPWYLVRQKSIPVREFGIGAKGAQMPASLDGWFLGRGLGEKRLARLCRLYVYRELAIASRYGDRVQGHVEGLDRAFAEFFNEGEEGVDGVKNRLDFDRSLRTANAGAVT